MSRSRLTRATLATRPWTISTIIQKPYSPHSDKLWVDSVLYWLNEYKYECTDIARAILEVVMIMKKESG